LEFLCRKHVFKAAYDVVLQGLAPLHVYVAAARAAANSQNVAHAPRGSHPSFDFHNIGNIFKRTVSNF
jgi:hypothetical protein